VGLSIAAKIVQDLGGSIRAESNSPKGARFVLRLPLDQAEQPSHDTGDTKPLTGTHA